MPRYMLGSTKVWWRRVGEGFKLSVKRETFPQFIFCIRCSYLVLPPERGSTAGRLPSAPIAFREKKCGTWLLRTTLHRAEGAVSNPRLKIKT